jgi:hypothetical protein
VNFRLLIPEKLLLHVFAVVPRVDEPSPNLPVMITSFRFGIGPCFEEHNFSLQESRPIYFVSWAVHTIVKKGGKSDKKAWRSECGIVAKVVWVWVYKAQLSSPRAPYRTASYCYT